MQIQQDPRAKEKFESYPEQVSKQMKHLRKLVLDTAEDLGTIDTLEETVKWGEPSYLVKKGSTIRMDWKEKTPDQYAMYFKCTSSLVETFKVLYGDVFKYEKSRAIVFGLEDEVPETQLKDCIAMALQYHLLKNKPLLGR